MDFDLETGRPISKICSDTDQIKEYVGERYFKIWDFMIFNFKLEKTELYVYAIIFAMHKSRGTYFRGSREYLAKWSGSSVRTVATALKSLEEKRYIDKCHRVVNGKKRVVYYINFEMLPTCKTFSSENYARDVCQRYVRDQEKLGRHVDRDEIYSIIDQSRKYSEEEAHELAKRYVANRDRQRKVSV